MGDFLEEANAVELFFQFEPGDDTVGVKVDVRCREHLPKNAVVVDSESERQRKVGSWLRADNVGSASKPAYHPNHHCMVCSSPKTGARQ